MNTVMSMPAGAGSEYTERRPNSMLLVLPVPFLVRGEELFFEEQACNGLNRWADHFERVVVAAPVIPEPLAAGIPSLLWKDTARLESRGRIKLLGLPWAYRLPDFIKHYRVTRARLRAAIAESAHLQFAIGGLIGDWAGVAASEAIRQRRRFAIHTDRVEHEVLREVTRKSSRLKRSQVSLI